MNNNSASDTLRTVLEYHTRTKHYFDHYARALDYLDWSSQPEPFRRYENATLVSLSITEAVPRPPTYDELYGYNAVVPRKVSVGTLAQLFYDSLAISAWKAITGSRWSLRCNPSSGNLHPTEAYLLCGPVDGLCKSPGLFHYTALEHALEQRGSWPDLDWPDWVAETPPNTFFIGLSSIHWRESWKYGERAYRYCQHDIGHAMAALSFAASTMGWSVHSVVDISDDLLACLLGIHGQRGAEAEHPDCLLAVIPDRPGTLRGRVNLGGLAQLKPQGWARHLLDQRPNDLSRHHQEWPVIDQVAAACRISGDSELSPGLAVRRPLPVQPLFAKREIIAHKIIRQRRSAVAMDGCSSMDSYDLVRMLYRVLPDSPPLSVLSGEPTIHLLVFVHRIDGLQPGLYLLPRTPGAGQALRKLMREDFIWQEVKDLSANLPLFRLMDGDCRGAAKTVSCHQDIAADGAFAIAMLSEFEPRLQRLGAAEYRRIHWEAGAIGQVLYLEAEAAGLRSTGIGCFFDDAVHDLLGFSTGHFQTVYHFTVGGAIEDNRISTLPAYPPR